MTAASSPNIELEDVSRSRSVTYQFPQQSRDNLNVLTFNRNSPSPSIIKTIQSFSTLRSKSSFGDAENPDDVPAEASDAEPQREWARAVVLCALGTAGITILNIILVVSAVALSQVKYDDASSLYKGSCSLSKGWATGLHLLINIFSTLLLGASNYCMQRLCAPSRADVDKAHAKSIWLEIGTSGLRNLWYIRTRRKILWFILLATSLPIHLIYNSAVYFVLTTSEYPILVAPSDLGFYDNPIDSLGNEEADGCFEWSANQTVYEFASSVESDRIFKRLDKQECVNEYAVDFITNRGPLVVLVSDMATGQDPISFGGMATRVDPGGLQNRPPYQWMCNGFSYTERDHCTKDSVLNALDTWSIHGANFTSIEWTTFMPTPEGVTKTVDRGMLDETRLNETLNWMLDETYVNGTLNLENLRQDLENLESFLSQDPGRPEVRQYLDNATNWRNSSWAASVTYNRQLSCGLSEPPPNSAYLPVEGCLSPPSDENCKLKFDWSICFIVIACNIVKVVCMFLVAKENRGGLLLTIGDAVSSFITNPDPATAGQCLMSKKAFCKTPAPWSKLDDEHNPRGKTTIPTRQRIYNRIPFATYGQKKPGVKPGADLMAKGLKPRSYSSGQSRSYQAASVPRWIIAITLASASLGTGMGLLQSAVSSFKGDKVNHGIADLWNMGFGEPNADTLISSFARTKTLSVRHVLLANAPQLHISLVYFTYNSLLTSMVLSAEYIDYGVNRIALRVSWPKGLQRSTYYLTLPYKYSVPLLSASAVLHWLVSQSFFYVRIDSEEWRDGTLVEDRIGTISTCGYSPFAIMTTIIFGSLMTLALILLGIRKHKSPVPVAGNCSAAISAACHPPAGDKNAAFKPVMWGEVATEEDDDRVAVSDIDVGSDANGSDSTRRADIGDDDAASVCGHCSFTSKEVVAPSDGKLYA